MAKNHRRGFGENAPAFQRGEPPHHQAIREVQASVAKTHFSQLLDEVENGTTIVVVRHGKPIARIVPEAQRRQQEINEAIADIHKLGQEIHERHGPITIEEIISSIHEGHKY